MCSFFSNRTRIIKIDAIYISKKRLIMEYNLPYFPDYSIIFPSTYKGYERKNTGVIIINKKGKFIKGPSWKLNNPEFDKKGYNELYQKNVIGAYSQTIYEGDIYRIYDHLKKLK